MFAYIIFQPRNQPLPQSLSISNKLRTIIKRNCAPPSTSSRRIHGISISQFIKTINPENRVSSSRLSRTRNPLRLRNLIIQRTPSVRVHVLTTRGSKQFGLFWAVGSKILVLKGLIFFRTGVQRRAYRFCIPQVLHYGSPLDSMPWCNSGALRPSTFTRTNCTCAGEVLLQNTPIPQSRTSPKSQTRGSWEDLCHRIPRSLPQDDEWM